MALRSCLTSYRIPCNSVAPGATVAAEEMCIIEAMPVKSIITYPKTGAIMEENRRLSLRGHAWAGDLEVATMEISINFGTSWQPCQLEKPANLNDWQQLNTHVEFPKAGYYEAGPGRQTSVGSTTHGDSRLESAGLS